MTTITMAADSIGLPRFATWFKNLNAKIQHQRQIRRTMNELSSLSDHALKDMGIARCDIYSIARGDETLNRSVKTNSNLEGWV